MSGGSYDYAYAHLEELASNIRIRTRDPKRLAFAELLELCAEAARDIEWVDSGDYGPGDEEAALDAVFAFSAPTAMVAELTQQIIALEGRVASVRELLSSEADG